MTIQEKIKALPDSPGIYQFYDNARNLIYVGKSVSIKKRVRSYFTHKSLGPKTDLLVKKIEDIKNIKVFSEFEALLLEAELIRTHKPFFNIIARDDKSPVYIKISKEDIPLISMVRKHTPEKGEFLKGPFPSAKTTRGILKMMRKIFPYVHHKQQKKLCLYFHLGLCPEPWQSEEARQKYKEDITRIKRLLSGQIKTLIKDLTGQMKDEAKSLNFEKADEIKKQVEKLFYITSEYRDPLEFLNQPTLVDDITNARVKDLQLALGLKNPLKRIECYDISNTSGKQATGSMVVFTDGLPDKQEYRRFKIKFLDTPNDFEMMKEVLKRRFSRHPRLDRGSGVDSRAADQKQEWPLPDLIIIDGGKGQLSSAVAALSHHKLTIPVVSLAKRLEELYIPNREAPVSLPKESPARQLAQAIRDEAHRFAITYHRLLRSKRFLHSNL